MGKNAKLNRELAKLGMALSREDLYYYICYKVEKYLTYKKTCRIANEIVLSNGFKCMTSFDDREMDANYNKLLAMAKIKNFTFDIKDVLSINKTVNNLDMVYVTIIFKGSHSFNIVYRESETHNKLIELFKSYKMQ